MNADHEYPSDVAAATQPEPRTGENREFVVSPHDLATRAEHSKWHFWWRFGAAVLAVGLIAYPLL